MRKYLFLILLTTLVVACSSRKKDVANGGQTGGMMAPDFTLETIDGGSFTLSSLRGKYVVLDFWGSWCPWCSKGFPELKRYYAKYKGKMEVVGIDCNDTEEAWKASVRQNGLPWTQVRNNEGQGDVLPLYGVNGFPTKYLISPSGEMLGMAVGEDPNFYALLDRVLGGKGKSE